MHSLGGGGGGAVYRDKLDHDKNKKRKNLDDWKHSIKKTDWLFNNQEIPLLEFHFFPFS
jgi:hypothetical protein